MKKKEKDIVINGKKYEVVEEDRDCLDVEELLDKATDYFYDYDYIFGDYAYEKLRLKGYYDSKNKKATKINDIKYLEDYKKNYCNYGSKTFLIKKVG